jgi:CheY-like chemotaxis protein
MLSEIFLTDYFGQICKNLFIKQNFRLTLQFRKFTGSVKGFTKNPLGVIALFIVLIYGFATLSVTYGNNLRNHVTILVYFLIIFPVIVFAGLLWLVTKHHDKIYGSPDFNDESNFLNMRSAASLAIASAKHPDELYDIEEAEFKLNGIIEAVSRSRSIKVSHAGDIWMNKILWIDDRPENNIYEREAFKARGIEFDLALSTDEAIDLLRRNKYAAIISDMRRKEGFQEGYVLLEKIRESGNSIPFFIYAGSNDPEHKLMAAECGAQGSTNRPNELFEMVMNRIS